MPNDWADWAHVAIGARAGQANALAGVVGQVAHDAMPNGGPQAFECYTYDDHDAGTTRLTFGCVNNVEIAGAGRTTEVRGGGVLSGAGRVDRWTMNAPTVDVTKDATGSIGVLCALCPTFPSRGVDERRGVWIEDPAARNYLAGRTQVDRLEFKNGWSLQANGDSLELWDAKGIVHIFR